VDEALLYALNALAASPPMAAIGVALSSRWVLLVIGAPLLAVYGIDRLAALRSAPWRDCPRARRLLAALSVALAVGASDQVSGLVKGAVGRERPCRALAGLVQPAGCGQGRSFPSTHAVNAFTLAVAAAPPVRLGWAVLLPIAALVSASRVLLGVHYPSDVLGGAVIGALLGLAAIALRRAIGSAIGRRSGVRAPSPNHCRGRGAAS
jgi:membrane-associated phospholipid phosphatase